jgi:hypothetical protein
VRVRIEERTRKNSEWREDCVSRFCDSLEQKRGRIKSRQGKQNFMWKIGRQYYTYGITEYLPV